MPTPARRQVPRVCLCNDAVKMHFEEVLRGVYPTEEADRSPAQG